MAGDGWATSRWGPGRHLTCPPVVRLIVVWMDGCTTRDERFWFMIGKTQLDETTRDLRRRLKVSNTVSIGDLAKVVGARAKRDITIDAYDFECGEI